MSPRVQVEGLSWQAGGRPILQQVDLTVGRGQVVGLLGPNGSGKSSVLRALLGLLTPSAGLLRLDGVATDFGAHSLRRQLGVVFQGPSLDGKLSCVQNLRLSAQLYGLRGAAAAEAVAGALQLVELQGRSHERAEVLSGGMRRRLELARALLHRPNLLLLDEPTQGLDPVAQRRIWERLQQVRRAQGVSVLVSSHDAEEASHCDQVLVLVAGQVVACDTPAALMARVGGDVIRLEGAPGTQPEALAAQVQGALGILARSEDNAVVVERPQGHTWVPRLVEAVGAERLRSISVRKPSMADAFFAVTGQALARRRALVEPADA